MTKEQASDWLHRFEARQQGKRPVPAMCEWRKVEITKLKKILSDE
jgi:hypothetical protein